MIRTVLVIPLVVALFGCAQNSPPSNLTVHGTPVKQDAHSQDKEESQSISAALHTVLQLPIAQKDQEAEEEQADAGSLQTVAIPTPMTLASDAEQYYLQTRVGLKLVYIVKSGGIADHLRSRLGPWSTDDPRVARLVSLVNPQSVAEQHPK